MAIPLAGHRRWIFAASLMILAGIHLALAGAEFAASHYASRTDLQSLERAVRLSPGNADYRDRLGRYRTYVVADPQGALADFESAVRLNPYDANYWLDVASARQVAGNPEGQREAIESALRAEPTAPSVAWQAANLFLVEGDESRALREFRVVIENDASLSSRALQTCWRAHPDVDLLLRDAVPPNSWSLLSFLDLLMAKHETEGTLKVWDRLIRLHEKFEPQHLFEYVRYLVEARRPDTALSAWEEASPLLGLSGYLPTQENLVVNPDFSLDILNGGFDWTYAPRFGVHPILDPSDFREGHRSLSITFDGPGIDDAGIQQLIPVRGGTAYNFSAYYKSAPFEGAGGPEIVLRDAYSGAVLFASDPLTNADFWKRVGSEVTTPGATNLVALRIERSPAGSPIRGKLWLDTFVLSPAGSKDHP